MRLWTLHPRYLDPKGLVALWREALLAQKVLQGNTKGYRNHSQLLRFKQMPNSAAALAAYLVAIHDEAARRKYDFDATKIAEHRFTGTMPETKGQLLYEWEHLKSKLEQRAPEIYARHLVVESPMPHPLFQIVEGDVRDWERIPEQT
ncbi:MAG: pyrimidine dimer DNA glycosylase/endonuclease V [Blastocatellia bacterium]